MAKKMTTEDAKKMTILLIVLIVIALIVMLAVGIYSISSLFNSNKNAVQNSVNEVANETINLEEYEYPEIDKKNIVVTAGEDTTNTKYFIKAYDALGLFSAKIDDGKVYIEKNDLTGKYDELYPNSFMQSNTKYEVLNLGNSATNIKIGYLGNDYMKPVLVILQNNGKVSYVDIANSALIGTFEATELNAKRVIRIENVTIDTGNSENMGILIMQDDNTIYNLEDLIS